MQLKIGWLGVLKLVILVISPCKDWLDNIKKASPAGNTILNTIPQTTAQHDKH